MTLRAVVSPPLPHLLELYAREGVMPRLHFRAAMLQALRAETIGFYAGERIMAAALLYPLAPERPDEDLRELLFACRPEAARHVAAIVRHARRARASWSAHLTPGCAVQLPPALPLTPQAQPHPARVRIRVTVMRGHAPGERLALLCGLKPIGRPGHTEWYELTEELAWAVL